MKQQVANAMAILKGEKAPVPFIIWSPAPFICSAVGELQSKEFYLDPEKKMQVQLKAIDMFPDTWVLPGVWPDFGAVLEPSMFGSKIRYFDNDAPQAFPVVDDYEDIYSIRFNWRDSLLPEMLRQYEYMWKNLPQHYIDDYGFLDGVGYVLGPVETACLLIGMTNFLMGILEEPEMMHKLLEIVMEGLLFSLHEQEKINGKLKTIYLPEHTSNQVGREAFEEFCFPYYKQIADEFPGCELFLYHNEGRQIHIGDLVDKFGANVTHFGDPIDQLLPKLADGVVLMGNLHPIKDMLELTPQKLYEKTMSLLRTAPAGRLWLSTAGGMAPGTPLENLQAVLKALDDFNQSDGWK